MDVQTPGSDVKTTIIKVQIARAYGSNFSSCCRIRLCWVTVNQQHKEPDEFLSLPLSASFTLQLLLPRSDSSGRKITTANFYLRSNADAHPQQTCSRLAWSRDPSWRRCWRRWKIWSLRPAGMLARPASPCRAWTPLTSPWCSSPCGMMASTLTAATETWRWVSTSAGENNFTNPCEYKKTNRYYVVLEKIPVVLTWTSTEEWLRNCAATWQNCLGIVKHCDIFKISVVSLIFNCVVLISQTGKPSWRICPGVFPDSQTHFFFSRFILLFNPRRPLKIALKHIFRRSLAALLLIWAHTLQSALSCARKYLPGGLAGSELLNPGTCTSVYVTTFATQCRGVWVRNHSVIIFLNFLFFIFFTFNPRKVTV